MTKIYQFRYVLLINNIQFENRWLCGHEQSVLSFWWSAHPYSPDIEQNPPSVILARSTDHTKISHGLSTLIIANRFLAAGLCVRLSLARYLLKPEIYNSPMLSRESLRKSNSVLSFSMMITGFIFNCVFDRSHGSHSYMVCSKEWSASPFYCKNFIKEGSLLLQKNNT